MTSGPRSVPTWADARDHALERLVEQARPREFFGFREQLLEATAEVVATSEGKAIVFLGRSPENLYDLLRGLLAGVRRAPDVRLLPFSFREGTTEAARRLARTRAPAVDGLERHLDQLGLGPAAIDRHPRGVAFVDCVAWGTTLGNLDELLCVLARRRQVDPRAVQAKVRYVGLTKASIGWTHWRSDEESLGARFFAEGRAAVVPISTRLWHHLAESSTKTMDSYPPRRWHEPPRLPPLDEERARAIRLAADLLAFGRSRDVRRAFAGLLGRRARPDRPWLGSLIVSILRSTQRRKARSRTKKR